MNMMTPAETKLRKTRSQVVQRHPFYGALLLKQKLHEGGCETMATNGKTLKYNPEFVMECTAEDLFFVVCHEALHPGLGHHVRSGGRDHDMWNRACDYAINPILVESGLTAPPNILLRDDLAGLSAEQIFKQLQDEENQEPDQDPDQEPGDEGDDGDDGDQDGDQGDDDGDDGDQGDGDQEGDDKDGNGAGDGGGDHPDFGGTGSFQDAPTETEAERAAEEQEWKVALTQAANFAAAGDIPGSLQRQITGILEPKANWRELLRRFMDQFAKLDYTWSAPNRRFIGNGLYLPSTQSEQMPPMAFVVDCSGSMPDKALEHAASEIQSIADDLQPEWIDVIFHDTDIRDDVRRFEPGEDLNVSVNAGGGTKFAPVCDYINNADDQYAVVVWFTDLETWDWEQCEEPQSPVLFLDFTGRNADLAQFGEDVIAMEDD